MSFDADGLLTTAGTMTIARDATAGVELGTSLVGSGGGAVATTQRYMYLGPAAIEGAIRLLDWAGSGETVGDILETHRLQMAAPWIQVVDSK